MITEKIPPSDIDAEEATLGSLLIDGKAIDDIPFLGGDDFYHERNRIIFDACSELNKRHEGINQVTVAQELDRNGKLEECGGVAHLSHLISITPTSLDLVHYANIVQRLSVSRRLIEAGRRIEGLGYRADPDPGVALNEADGLLLDIRKNTVGTPIISPDERVRMLYERYENLYAKDKDVAVRTGISSLDYMLGGGLFNGEVLLVAARTSMGKTAFAQTIANNIGKTGKNVLYCTAEMSWESLSDRDMAGILKVAMSTIRLGGYEDELYVKMLGEGLEALRERELYLYDDSPLTTTKIMNAGMEMKLRRGLSLIVIDYLGILEDEYGRSPYERVSYLSRKTKQIARVLDVPVLALHQLSRALENRPSDERRPRLSDLRDSGALEEDADAVVFLYRENYYNEETDDDRTEVIMEKQRQGDDGGRHQRVYLMFDKDSKCYRGIKDKLL